MTEIIVLSIKFFLGASLSSLPKRLISLDISTSRTQGNCRFSLGVLGSSQPKRQAHKSRNSNGVAGLTAMIGRCQRLDPGSTPGRRIFCSIWVASWFAFCTCGLLLVQGIPDSGRTATFSPLIYQIGSQLPFRLFASTPSLGIWR